MKELVNDAIEQFLKKSIELELVRPISSGKEASVYLVRWNGDLYALKVYKDYITRSFQGNQEYLAGRHVKRISERRAMQKRNKFGKKLMHRLWVKREYYLMKKLFDMKANIPEPIEMVPNAILLEYVGNEMAPAPLLKDVVLTRNEADIVYKTIQRNIDIFEQAGIVHGDLSPFNILYDNSEVYIIDFPQSADMRNNPNASQLLQRDRDCMDEWYVKQSG